MKRRLSSLLLTVLIVFGASVGSFTNLASAAESSYQAAENRLAKLGVVNVKNVKPTAYITKEELARLLILLTNNGDLADQYKKTVMFSDKDFGTNYNGFVNAAAKKGYLTSAADGKFHPKDKVSFSIASTAIVKALGYIDSDLTGQWPQNYIDKAKSLGLTTGISLKSTDYVKWNDILIIADKAITTKVKKANANEADKTLAEANDFFGEYSILNIPAKSSKLDSDQILTDKGIIYAGAFAGKLDIAGKYRLHLDDNNTITKIFDQVKGISKVTVASATGLNVTYKDDLGKIQTLALSQKTTVYYNDTKQNIDNVPNLLKKSQTIFYAFNDSGIGVDYAIIISPTDSSLGTYYEQSVINTPATSAKLSDNQIQTDGGIYYLGSGVKMPELGVKYGFYVNNDTIVKFIETLNTVAKKIKIDSISGTTLSYTDDKGTSGTFNLPQKTLYYYNGSKINYESLSTVLKRSQTIMFSYNLDKSGYEYAVIIDPKEYTLGTYTEAYVLNLPSTNSAIGSNQVQLDSGIYYMPDDAQKLEAGAKYTFIINGDKIASIVNKLNVTKTLTVNSVKENTVWYTENGVSKSISLPDKAVYYYQGAKSSLSSVKNALTINTSMVLSYNDNQSGIAAVTVFDPIYSKPSIAFNTGASTKNIGDISLEGKSIIKNGVTISVTDIEDYAAVYNVSDIWGGNNYIQVIENYVDGVVSAVTPNVLSPKSITVDSKTYNISSQYDSSQFSSLSYLIDDESEARVIFGYDGNVVAVYSDQLSKDANINYAVILSSSLATSNAAEDIGKTMYNVKLMFFNGTTKTYLSDFNASYSIGYLVTYTLPNDTHISITQVGREGWPWDGTIHKENYMLGNKFVSKAVRIFNQLPSNNGEANIQLVRWNDLPENFNISNKIQYAVSAGSFGDYYILVVSDLFNTTEKHAYVKSVTNVSSGKTTLYRHELLIDGNVISYTSSDMLNVGEAYRMNWYGGAAYTVASTFSETSVTSTELQAIDSRRIKLNNLAYLLKDSIQIYLKDTAGNIATMKYSDVKTGTYTNVTAFQDPTDGKVGIIFITK